MCECETREAEKRDKGGKHCIDERQERWEVGDSSTARM